MPIQYYLQPNYTTPDPNDQYARVTTTGNLTIDDIAARLVREGHVTSSAQAAAVLNAAMDIAARAVADGNAVNLPLMTIRPGITGVFTDVNDSFDPARHTVRANLQSGPLLDAAMSTATTQKKRGGAPAPDPISFTDLNTGSVNASITPGGMGQILGSELKFDPASEGAGIFLIADSDGSETAITNPGQRTEGRLLFVLPTSLDAGSYTLEVRRVYAGTLRAGALAHSLTVGAPAGPAKAKAAVAAKTKPAPKKGRR